MELNVFGVVVLMALLIDFLLGTVSSLLNLRSLRQRPPEGLSALYDPEEYRRSQSYTSEKTRLGLVSSLVQLLVLLGFWWGGGFNLLDVWLRGWGWGDIVTGLFFIGALLIGQMFLSFPFDLYATFVIEERYGFNRSSLRLFVTDLVKGLGLALVLGAPLLALILAFFGQAGSSAWIYCWVAISLWMLTIQFIAPSWILPLFNRFEPLPDGELRQSLTAYARQVRFPLSEVQVMDGSKRSGHSNAFFMGLGRRKRIALFDTLIEKHGVSEVLAILAHEVGHYKKGHILQGLALQVIQLGLMLFLLSVVLESTALFAAFGMDHMSTYAGLVFFGLLYSPLEMIFSVALQAVSRRHEFQADRFAAETADAGALGEALKKLAKTNLTNLTPHPLHVFLNYSHPPLHERLSRLEETAGISGKLETAG